MVVGTSPSRSQSRPPRRLCGLAALVFPVAVVAMAIDAGFGVDTDLAAGFLSTIAFLLVAPTAWIFAIEFIDASRFTVIAVGLVTSLPLWYLLGSVLGAQSRSWTSFFARYATAIVVWIALNVTILVAIDRFTT